MTEYLGKLIDDDGLIVVSTSQQMAVIGQCGFDYDIPAELLALMTDGRIVAWETGGEDEYSIEVVFASEAPTGSLGAYRLSALADDTGIVVPYSQFSYAVDCNNGVVADTLGLALRFPIGPGEHNVFLSKVPAGFTITVTPAQHPVAPLTDALPIIRATKA